MRKSPKRTLYDCDRCKFTYRKIDLRKQRGMLLCDPCFDTTLEIPPVNMKVLSPRANSTSTAAVTSPIVFTITSAGIAALSKSQIFTREGTTNSFVMYVVGSGPITVTAATQIAAGIQGTLLTLVGTDDTNYVIISTGNGTDLTTKKTLKNGNTLSLVYNTTSSLWCETSRS